MLNPKIIYGTINVVKYLRGLIKSRLNVNIAIVNAVIKSRKTTSRGEVKATVESVVDRANAMTVLTYAT